MVDSARGGRLAVLLAGPLFFYGSPYLKREPKSGYDRSQDRKGLFHVFAFLTRALRQPFRSATRGGFLAVGSRFALLVGAAS